MLSIRAFGRRAKGSTYRHDIMTMRHDIIMHGQHVMLNAHNIEICAHYIMKNSLHIKKSAQHIMKKTTPCKEVNLVIWTPYQKMGLDARKPVFGGLRTTQAQTSLRIRAI